MKPKIIVLLILFVLLVVILLQNTQVVTFQILFWKISMSRVLFLPLILVVGFILGYSISAIQKKKSKKIPEEEN